AGRGLRTTATRRRLLRLLASCTHSRLQDAVDASGPGTRVLVLPGVYREAVIVRGRDRQLEGLGRRARDVVVRGDRRAADVIRAERADGLVIADLTAEQGAASDVHVVRTDGFRLHRLVVRWAQDNVVRTDGADHGLLDRIEAYGNGSAGLRVGAGAEGRCGSRRGLEVRDFNVYGNVLGLWVAAGDAVWAHHARLAGNATGAASAPLGPQTPRGCLRLEHLSIAANNAEVYAAAAPCRTAPFARRPAAGPCCRRARAAACSAWATRPCRRWRCPARPGIPSTTPTRRAATGSPPRRRDDARRPRPRRARRCRGGAGPHGGRRRRRA